MSTRHQSHTFKWLQQADFTRITGVCSGGDALDSIGMRRCGLVGIRVVGDVVIGRIRLIRVVHIQDWERRVSTRGEHCQQLVVNSRHDLKRGVGVDFVGDLQQVKLLCRSKQQCCSTFPSVGNSTVELVAVQLGVTAASECFVLCCRRPWCHTCRLLCLPMSAHS